MNFLKTSSAPVSIEKKEEKRPFKIYKIVVFLQKKKQEAKKNGTHKSAHIFSTSANTFTMRKIQSKWRQARSGGKEK